jgi:ATP-dependent DNA helicase RecG
MLLAVAERKQAALMAPTELLAEQHFASISRMLEGSNVCVGLLTGKRGEDRQGVADGSIDIVVGTHALLSESVRFHDLAVVVIDEQHRFGVQQRARLQSGNGNDQANVPHTLVMTATPIPRTLSLTLFGDLDVSILDELPPGRVPCVNKVVPPDKEQEVYEYVRQRIEGGEQVFVVVPMIDHEPSEQELWELEQFGSGGSPPSALKSVTQHAEHLQKRYFKGFKVDAVHGRLKPEERQRVIQHFRGGGSQVLVATTVIEVGVDIPRAGVMVIEHAERFGLAQLHQLRGRIGRGSPKRKPLCVFIAQPTTDEAKRRMDAIKSTNDGFKIAELDLEIRGMGQLLGLRQSGDTGLRVADLIHDMDLLRLAKGDAEQIIQRDATLEQPQHALLRKVMEKQLAAAMGLVDVG